MGRPYQSFCHTFGEYRQGTTNCTILLLRGKNNIETRRYFLGRKFIFVFTPYQSQQIEEQACNKRLPIHKWLLHLILDKVDEMFTEKNQHYLALREKTMITGYYGLLRVSELTISPHTINAQDVHLATNKRKLLLCLKTSKTHTEANKPQIVKMGPKAEESEASHLHPAFCPCSVMVEYLNMQGDFNNDDEPLFVFRAYTGVKADQFCRVLKTAIKLNGLNESLYNSYSLRMGRSCDLYKDGMEISKIQNLEDGSPTKYLTI